MTSILTVFVNGSRVEVPAGASVIDAVEASDKGVAGQVRGGARAVVDSRGLPVNMEQTLSGGFVMRIVSARVLNDAPGAQ